MTLHFGRTRPADGVGEIIPDAVTLDTLCVDGPLASFSKALLDGDFGDSLFPTQYEVEPVRTVRRHRPLQYSSCPDASSKPTDDEGPCSPDHAWEAPLVPKKNLERRRRQRWKGHIFPFLEKFYQRKYLPRHKALTFEHAALGGFFKCMKKMKSKSTFEVDSQLISASVLSKQHCLDDREISPLSEPEEIEDSEENISNDIKPVEQCSFIKQFKKRCRGRNPWYEQNCSSYAKMSLTVNEKESRLQKLQTASTSGQHPDNIQHLTTTNGNSDISGESAECNSHSSEYEIYSASCSVQDEEDSSHRETCSVYTPSYEPEELTADVRERTLIDEGGRHSATRLSGPVNVAMGKDIEGPSQQESDQNPQVVQLKKKRKGKGKKQCPAGDVETYESLNVGTVSTEICGVEEEEEEEEERDDVHTMALIEPCPSEPELAAEPKKRRRRESLQHKPLEAGSREVPRKMKKGKRDLMKDYADVPDHVVHVLVNEEDDHLRQDEETEDLQDIAAENEGTVDLRDATYAAPVSLFQAKHASVKETAEDVLKQNTLDSPPEPTTDKKSRKRKKEVLLSKKLIGDKEHMSKKRRSGLAEKTPESAASPNKEVERDVVTADNRTVDLLVGVLERGGAELPPYPRSDWRHLTGDLDSPRTGMVWTQSSPGITENIPCPEVAGTGTRTKKEKKKKKKEGEGGKGENIEEPLFVSGGVEVTRTQDLVSQTSAEDTGTPQEGIGTRHTSHFCEVGSQTKKKKKTKHKESQKRSEEHWGPSDPENEGTARECVALDSIDEMRHLSQKGSIVEGTCNRHRDCENRNEKISSKPNAFDATGHQQTPVGVTSMTEECGSTRQCYSYKQGDVAVDPKRIIRQKLRRRRSSRLLAMSRFHIWQFCGSYFSSRFLKLVYWRKFIRKRKK